MEGISYEQPLESSRTSNDSEDVAGRLYITYMKRTTSACTSSVDQSMSLGPKGRSTRQRNPQVLGVTN